MMYKSYFLTVFMTLQLVHNIDCDIISDFIDEVKEWTDYFGLSESLDWSKYYTNEDNSEESPKKYDYLENINEKLESQIEKPITEDGSTLRKEFSKEKEHFEQLTDFYKNRDKIDPHAIVEEKESEVKDESLLNINSNTEKVVKVNSTFGSDSVKTKKRNTGIEIIDDDWLEYNSKSGDEIIIYDDMVKIDSIEEKESNEQNNYVNKNDKTAIKYLTESNHKKNTVNEDDVDNALHLLENNIHINEDENILKPSTTPGRKQFVELPIADDEDYVSIPPVFSKCDDAQESLSSCTRDKIYLPEENEDADECQSNFIKSVKDVENNSKVSQTSEEESDQLLQENQNNESQYDTQKETSNSKEDNGNFIENSNNKISYIRSENGGIILNNVKGEYDEKSKMLLNENENQKEEICKETSNDIDAHANKVEEIDFELTYRKKDTENFEEYYDRIFHQNEGEDDMTFDNRIVKLHSLFSNYPIWENYNYFKYLLKHYTKLYSKKDNEDTEIYHNRIFSRRDSESEEAFEERMNWLREVLTGLALFIDDVSNSYLLSDESFHELGD